MKNSSSVIFLSKLSVFALLGLITLCADVTTSPTQQRLSVQTEQCDAERSVKSNIPFSKFSLVGATSFFYEPVLLSSLFFL